VIGSPTGANWESSRYLRPLQLAREQDLDPSVEGRPGRPTRLSSRLMDFGEVQVRGGNRRAKEFASQKYENISIKEMKYRPKIGVGDFRHQDPVRSPEVLDRRSQGQDPRSCFPGPGRGSSHPELGAKILDSIRGSMWLRGREGGDPHARLDGRTHDHGSMAPDKRAQAAAKAENLVIRPQPPAGRQGRPAEAFGRPSPRHEALLRRCRPPPSAPP